MSIWRMRTACWMSKDTQAHARALAPTTLPPHAHREICTTYLSSSATMVS